MKLYPWFPLLPAALPVLPYRHRPEILHALPKNLTFESACEELASHNGTSVTLLREEALAKVLLNLENKDILQGMYFLGKTCTYLLAYVFVQAARLCLPGNQKRLREAKIMIRDLSAWVETGAISNTVVAFLEAESVNRSARLNDLLRQCEREAPLSMYPWKAWRTRTLLATPRMPDAIPAMRAAPGPERCYWTNCPERHPIARGKLSVTCPTCWRRRNDEVLKGST